MNFQLYLHEMNAVLSQALEISFQMSVVSVTYPS